MCAAAFLAGERGGKYEARGDERMRGPVNLAKRIESVERKL